ncbi:MAG TPA: hypothetical protein VED41_09620, partial [Solirubrobacteraceae bacterium]|nr:hypothetical protein [Solirubrobacteraceae bacterium]
MLLAACALAGASVLASAHTHRAPRSELASSAQSASMWSAPAALSRCPAEAPARVVFPSDSPSHGTGPGAIVWSAAAGCPGGAGA